MSMEIPWATSYSGHCSVMNKENAASIGTTTGKNSGGKLTEKNRQGQEELSRKRKYFHSKKRLKRNSGGL